MTKKISPSAASMTLGSSYPAPFDKPCAGRLRRRLGDAAQLTQFGVNHTRLPPGCWSSQRHWHTLEDEFVFVLEGEVVLVTDSGEEVLHTGDCAGFKAGVADGHHLQNRSNRDAFILEIGSRNPDEDQAFYSDVDLYLAKGSEVYLHKNGEQYADQQAAD